MKKLIIMAAFVTTLIAPAIVEARYPYQLSHHRWAVAVMQAERRGMNDFHVRMELSSFCYIAKHENMLWADEMKAYCRQWRHNERWGYQQTMPPHTKRSAKIANEIKAKRAEREQGGDTAEESGINKKPRKPFREAWREGWERGRERGERWAEKLRLNRN